ncbi:transmembrane amino acid transporter protein-domain-containing protein [Gorgonomyces haynaldii]|nr:transmembrane amino acid transporter protein-domain-containing protein [Gorgonomyces haynaldii]
MAKDKPPQAPKPVDIEARRDSSPKARSLPRSIPPPKTSPGRIVTPSSYFLSSSLHQAAQIAKRRISTSQATGSYNSQRSRTDSVERYFDPEPEDDAVNLIISEHLVNQENNQDIGSVSHSLLGGAVTRDIYKWNEERQQNRPRRNSEPELAIDPTAPHASDLREPGMFRRHFIANQAQMEGRPEPNFVTRNFLDFLVLFGFFGGDVYPSDIEDEEYDIEPSNENTPLLRASSTTRSVPHVKGTSESKAFFMLTKAFVGTGVLFLPSAFANGGLLFSVVLLIILGFLTLHCMLLLAETSQKLENKSFGDIGFHLYGEWFRQVVLQSISVSQMGFCCAYLIFVGQNLRDLVMIATNCQTVLPDWVFILFQLLVYIPLAWVRRIKNFGITSLIADVFILLGLGYIFFYDLVQIGGHGFQQVPYINLQSFSLFVGTAMFAFEGICLMLPIAQSMEHPERFGNVLTACIITISVIFLTIGALSYLSFGNKVETIIFLNLPKGPVTNGIQFLYVIAIMLSFPLTVYPAIRILEQQIFGISTGKSSNLVKWEKNLFRATLVSFLGLIAWLGSASLDKVVSLVGCFACIPLSFIYPALFHSRVAESKWVRAKDWGLVGFGIIATIYTTMITVQQWATEAPNMPRDRCKNPING